MDIIGKSVPFTRPSKVKRSIGSIPHMIRWNTNHSPEGTRMLYAISHLLLWHLPQLLRMPGDGLTYSPTVHTFVL